MPDIDDLDPEGYDEPTVSLATEHRPALRFRAARIVVEHASGDRDEKTFELPHIRIGSAPNNDLPINDTAVSRYHCELRHTEDGFLLRDLGSTNGTKVSGIKVREAMLEEEAVIHVGNSSIRLMPGREERVDPSRDVQFGDIVGRSPVMRDIFGILEKVANTDLTVTIQGETGTGKDLVARALHTSSPRADGPFVVFDAGAVSSNLIESDLFGHERGAFTGATEQRQGAFERADGGTLFLDEIGELAIELQPKLLRVLERREVQRVGGARPIPVDVRVVCATNRDLLDEAEEGRFREDLYFRLSVVVLPLPPLRERPEDVELLIGKFLNEGEPRMTAAADAVQVLRNYEWPGNVRELRNVIEAARALCSEPQLHARHLMFARDRDLPGQKSGGAMSLAGKTLESIEKAAIEQTLAHYDGNRSAAARALGIAPSTLYLKLKKYQIS